MTLWTHAIASLPGVAGLLVIVALLVWPTARGTRAVRARVLRDRSTGERGVRVLSPRLARLRRWVGGAARRHADDAAHWLPVLDQLAAGLRVGLPPAEALTLALRDGPASARDRLRPVLISAAEGRACGPTWLRVARAANSSDLEVLARSWSISERLGAPLADAVDSAARAMRSARDLSNRLQTATVGARTTATILTCLPVAGIGIALLMGIGPVELYGTVPALASLVMGAVVIAVGRVIVTRMIDRVVRQS